MVSDREVAYIVAAMDHASGNEKARPSALRFGAEFIVLPEASHSINWEQPEAFNRNVLGFIGRH